MRTKTQGLIIACLVVYSNTGPSAWLDRELAVLDITNQQRNFNGLAPLHGDNRLREAAFGHSASMGTYDFFSHTTLAGPNPTTVGQRILAAGYNWVTFGGAATENISAGAGWDFIGFGIGEMDPLSAARDLMYGTTSLTALSSYDSNFFFGSGFASWDGVGDGWGSSEWSNWGRGLMGSNIHRGNILGGAFTDLGVGYFWDPSDSGQLLTDFGQESGFPLRTYWTQTFAAGDSNPGQVVPIPGGVWLFGSALVVGLGAIRRKTN